MAADGGVSPPTFTSRDRHGVQWRSVAVVLDSCSAIMAWMGTRWQNTDAPRGDEYDARWARLAASGESIHGEADLVDGLLGGRAGSRVLDAGCGTGRVALELAGRGYAVVGVDADADMLDAARAKDPALPWLLADLASPADARLPATFDLILLAGNVMIFLDPGSEGRVVRQLAGWLSTGGLLVAGFSIRPDRLQLADYDRLAAAAGLALDDRWATWGREPFAGGDYAVSVHRAAGAASA